MLEDCQGAFEDLNKSNALEPNNAFTFKWCGHVKRMLEDSPGALRDIEKANVFEPNNVATPLWPSVRMKLTLPKLGTWSPPGLSKTQNLISGVKTPRIGVFLVSLESS
jgi:hypothetical protein